MIQQAHFWVYIHKHWKQGLKRRLHTQVHRMIPDSQNEEAAQVSVDRWTDKHSVVCAYMEYHSALKREEIPTHATTWMNLEAIVLSEIRQPPEDKSRGFLFSEVLQ